MVRIFDVQGGEIIPTEHCYSMKSLKAIIDEYPQDYMEIFKYIFYMTCPNPDLNPFFNTRYDEKEELILDEINLEVSTEDPIIIKAIEKLTKYYETETSRAYMGIKVMLDKIAKYMENSEIVDGRDGNGSFIIRAAKDFADIRKSYKEVYTDLMDEQKSIVRGGKNLAYDTD